MAGATAGAEYRWPGPWLAGASLGYAHVSVSQATAGYSAQSYAIGVEAGRKKLVRIRDWKKQNENIHLRGFAWRRGPVSSCSGRTTDGANDHR